MNGEPIRVAQMMTDMNYGGVEMVVMNYYRHIDRSRVQFDFFVFEGSTIPQREEIEKLGGRVYIVPRCTNVYKYEKVIQGIFKENKYSIVHCHMNTLGVFAMYGAKRAGVPVRILHNHSTAGKGETKKNIFKYALRPFAKLFPTHLCACSKLSGDWIYGKDSKYKIFNNAIDLDKFKYDENIRKEIREELELTDKKVIGHIGRFCYQKNHDLLIDIFNEILKLEKDVVLLLIGEGELEQHIKNKIRLLGIEESVVFLGRKADAYRYYQAMDLFLLPSRYEGLPVVGVEAQASGLPCVFSNNVTEETKILKNCTFVNNGIVEYLKYVLEFLEYKRYDASYELREAGFDIKTESQKLLMYYESLLEANI